jgi:hypothetical protein
MKIEESTGLRGERAYPIYQINVRWSEDYPPDAEKRLPQVGLPAGRFWNGTGQHRMEREDCDPEAVRAEIIAEWWPEYAKKRLAPADLSVEVKLIQREVWCSGWFFHWTWDVGLSDPEVLVSFERYVSRIQRSDRSETEIGSLLMGAQDRWRWTGRASGLPSEPTLPPCRCEGCKKLGIVRIVH